MASHYLLGMLASAAIFCASEPAFAQNPSANMVVHVTGDTRGIVMEQRVDGEWRAVCSASCDRPLLASQWYRVTGDGVAASEPVYLAPSPGGRAWLDVVAGHRTPVRTLGIVLVPLGGVLALVGGALLLTGAISENCPDCVAGYANTTQLNIGWAVLGVGVVMVIAGGVMLGWRPHSTTKVELVSFVRVTEPERRMAVARGAMTFPLLHVRF